MPWLHAALAGGPWAEALFRGLTHPAVIRYFLRRTWGRDEIDEGRLLGFAEVSEAGIENRIHPGQPMDKNLYDLPPKELRKIPTVCGSLREALENLDKDRAFLKNGGVFDDDFIDSYIELKMTEVERFEMTPHPVEFDMYYSV